jgi:hypothetical protein
MDELGTFLIGKSLEGGWTITEPRYVQRDASSAQDNALYGCGK